MSDMNKNLIEIQRLDQSIYCPDDKQFGLWVDTALGNIANSREVVIRVVELQESADLNLRYRNKQGATNILSFPADVPEFLDIPLLGDLVICAAVIEQQAELQHKAINNHWAHIVIHGVLHLLGYDHEEAIEAEKMEALEIELLSTLGIDNPYQEVIN